MDKKLLLKKIRMLLLVHPHAEVFSQVVVENYSVESLNELYVLLFQEVETYLDLLCKEGQSKDRIIAQWQELISREYDRYWLNTEHLSQKEDQVTLTNLFSKLI